jgi:hypothetical protein
VQPGEPADQRSWQPTAISAARFDLSSSVLVKIVGEGDGKEMRRMSSRRGSFCCPVAVRDEIGADRRSDLSGNPRAFNRPR